jgi:hypothetical protein
MSNINYQAIDSQFPRLGSDNSSQGFRDNFEYIKNGLAVAAAELSDLQSKALLKAPLNDDPFTSPLNTEWNIDGWNNLTNLRQREYYTFYKATGSLNPQTIISSELIMRDTINDKFYKFDFSKWGSSIFGSPVSYTRTRVNSDGTLTPFNNNGEILYKNINRSVSYAEGDVVLNDGKLFYILSSNEVLSTKLDNVPIYSESSTYNLDISFNRKNVIYVSKVQGMQVDDSVFDSIVNYNPENAYLENSYVRYNGIISKVTADIAPVEDIDDYNNTLGYSVNDIIKINDIIYTVTEEVDPLNQIPEYSGSTAYSIGTIIRYNNIIYISIALALGKLPTNTFYFRPVFQPTIKPQFKELAEEIKFKNIFSEDTLYNLNDAVESNGSLYRVIDIPGSGFHPEPPDSLYYELDSTIRVYEYQIVEFVKAAIFNSDLTYSVGDYVKDNVGNIYLTIQESLGNLLTNTDYFTLTDLVLDEIDEIDFGVSITRGNTLSIYNPEVESTQFNDFNLNEISNVVASNFFNKVWNPEGSQTESITIDIIAEGKSYYRYIVAPPGGGSSISLNITNWPTDSFGSGLYATIRIELVSNGTATNVHFGVANTTMGSGELYDSGEATITTPAAAGESVIFDVWSYDGGNTVFFNIIGKFKALLS